MPPKIRPSALHRIREQRLRHRPLVGREHRPICIAPSSGSALSNAGRSSGGSALSSAAACSCVSIFSNFFCPSTGPSVNGAPASSREPTRNNAASSSTDSSAARGARSAGSHGSTYFSTPRGPGARSAPRDRFCRRPRPAWRGARHTAPAVLTVAEKESAAFGLGGFRPRCQ